MSAGPTYQNVDWALTGVAGVLTIGRYLLRILHTRRLYWDDFFHGLAFIGLTIHSAINGVTADAKTHLTVLGRSKHTSSSALLTQYHYVSRLNTVNNVFLYLVFWLVKLAFLTLYRQLFSCSRNFLKAWWVVAIFTVVTYWIPFAGVLATCSGASTIPQFKKCNSADHTRAVKLEYTCAFNVATDVFIMALPLWMLRGLRMDVKQKLGMAFVFCLAFFCVALDILRTVEALGSNQALYTVLEINMVVIIDCLPVYSTLLSWRRRRLESKQGKQSKEWSGGDGSKGSAPRERSAVISQGEHDAQDRNLMDEGKVGVCYDGREGSTIEMSLLDRSSKAEGTKVMVRDLEGSAVPQEDTVEPAATQQRLKVRKTQAQ